MDKKARHRLEYEFKKYMDMFKEDKELGQLMLKITMQEIFNDEFLHKNSKFRSMDDLLYRGGFGMTNLMEVEKVDQEKWNAYIAANTDCDTWHQFGKLAMVEWMKQVIEIWPKYKAKLAKDAEKKKDEQE